VFGEAGPKWALFVFNVLRDAGGTHVKIFEDEPQTWGDQMGFATYAELSTGMFSASALTIEYAGMATDAGSAGKQTAAGSVEGFPTVPPPSPPPQSPLDANAIKVLELLNKCFPRQMKNVELETEAELSKDTVTRRLKELIDLGYAERPNGTQRMGSTITEAGRQALRRLGAIQALNRH
jgi:hypothetical protein